MDANQLDFFVASSLSAYLGANPSSQSISILTKVIQNARTKNESKYRKIRLSNPKIQENLVHTFGALDILALVGFEQRDEDAETFLCYVDSAEPESSANLMASKILPQLIPLCAAKTSTAHPNDSAQSFLSEEDRKKRMERMLAVKRERRKEREAVQRRIQEDKQERLTKQQRKAAHVNFQDEPLAMGIGLRKLRDALPEQAIPLKIPPQPLSEEKGPPFIGAKTLAATPHGQRNRDTLQAESDHNSLDSAKHAISKAEMEDRFASLSRCAPASGIRDSSVYRDKQDPSTGSCLKRLFRELREMDLPVNPSIWLRYDEESPQFCRFLIAAPPNTPYAFGLFAFDMKVPNDYPYSAPAVTLLTTGEGSVRFGPNLYINGKVCLSLLGSWNGPKWNPQSSSIQQVLVSIQGLILGVDHPYYLEPGFGGWEGIVKEGQFTQVGQTLRGEIVPSEVGLPVEVVEYEDVIRLGTLKYAIEDMIKVPSYLEGFRQEIHVHFYCNQDNLTHEVIGWQGTPCLGYSRPEAHTKQLTNCIERIKMQLSGLSQPSSAEFDTKPAAAEIEKSQAGSLPTLSEPTTSCGKRRKSSIDGMATLKEKSLPAAVHEESTQAVKLKENIGDLGDIQEKMKKAAADGNYIRAGRLQEQYLELLSIRAEKKVLKDTVTAGYKKVNQDEEKDDQESDGSDEDEESNASLEDEESDGSEEDLEDELDVSLADSVDPSLLFASYGGFQVGKNVFIPDNRSSAHLNPHHTWGKGATLSSNQEKCADTLHQGIETVSRQVPLGSGCCIRFRLPDGSTVTESFDKSDKLSSLYGYLKDFDCLRDSENPTAVASLVSNCVFAQPLSSAGYTLLLSHPKREFNFEMHGIKTIEELGLNPSATLTVMKCSYRGVVHRGELESRLAEAQNGAMDLDGLTYEGLLELTERVGVATPSDGMDFVGLSRETLEANSTLFSPSTYLNTMKQGEDGDSRCPVCLGDFDAEEQLPVLRQLRRCRHTFHTACLETWLKARSSCPICKTSVGGDHVSSATFA